ncbi:hypothetical protein [Nonomuraea soli]|uniref:Uncharacterized protein n=1 Tax=Nonomuraea soli TaxID=1032476 RepID=A0A7W0CGC6_9ACTN|nr:hypothetical protein [Nonomuraea soli]MBA2890670.1 hypothetical protein [Nonomuraea soli]
MKNIVIATLAAACVAGGGLATAGAAQAFDDCTIVQASCTGDHTNPNPWPDPDVTPTPTPTPTPPPISSTREAVPTPSFPDEKEG